jgi:diguanylate cyclase (GGDEF)-like protein
MARTGATHTRLLPGDYALKFAAGVLILYAAVVAAALIFWTTPLIQDFLSGTALMGASALAGAACLSSARTLPRPLHLPWLLFGIGAVFATLSHAGMMLSDVAIRSAVIHLIWSGGYVFFVAGIVMIIQQGEGGRWSELGIDVALVAAAATVLTLRWAPGIIDVSASSSPVTFFLLVLGPVAAFCAALFMIVALATPYETLPRYSLYAIAAGAIALGISALPQILEGNGCCHAGTTQTLAAIGMWTFVTIGASSALTTDQRAVLIPHGERLRQFVAPTVAVVLGAFALDAAAHPAVDRRTAVALAVLATLVALRLTQLLHATAKQVDERRELAQSRALIEVTRALAGANDLNTTLRTVTEWAKRVLNAKAATIELLSGERSSLVLRAASGMTNNVIGMKFPVEGSFTGWVVRNGESRVAPHAARDPLITVESAAYLGDAPIAAVPLTYRDRVLGVITCLGTQRFTSSDLELLQAFANQAALALEDARLFEQVRALSVTDPLTGIANRRRLDRELQREFAAAQRGRKLVAVMFDLDDFKQHNDRYGHLAGDRALKHFAQALEVTTRAMNLAARFGGDEFFALLADSDREGAIVFINRVVRRFEAIMTESGIPILKVSAGIAEYKADMTHPTELIEAADRALYISKSEGNASK